MTNADPDLLALMTVMALGLVALVAGAVRSANSQCWR
jgi:hypothetical protein